jgi:fatty acyl-CoA reductase
VSRLKEHIGEKGWAVDYTRSFAYGDTKWDIPVLDLVGNPAAVYPDVGLKAYAQSKNWKIIG